MPFQKSFKNAYIDKNPPRDFSSRGFLEMPNGGENPEDFLPRKKNLSSRKEIG